VSSDLTSAALVGGLAIWLILVLAGFFLVGALAGLIAIFAGAAIFGWVFVAAIRDADTTDSGP
jgi:hypothetical protein